MTIWGRMQRVEDKVEEHATVLTTAVTVLAAHVKSCDERGARVEKLVFFAVALVIAVLGFLIKPYFDTNPRASITYYQSIPPNPQNPGTPQHP